MIKGKKSSHSIMDEAFGGESVMDMKDVINSVSNVGKPVSKEEENSREITIGTEKVFSGSFEKQLDYYLRATTEKKPVYIDVELVKDLEQLIYKLKYSRNIRTLTMGNLIGAILKAFVEDNK